MNRLELYLKDLKDCFLPGRTLPSIGDDENLREAWLQTFVPFVSLW
jgi:hypothetical protein